jgi:hypothetical protein
MNHNQLFLNIIKLNKVLFVVMVLMISPAMAQQAEPATQPATSPAAEAALGDNVKPKDAAEEVDPGMQIPVDGSSLEAFEKSLETIKGQAKEPNYITLEEAIKYLLVYDLGTGGDKAKLAKNLDGLTGDQIIDKVTWRK